VSGIFLPLRVNSLPLATIYEVKTPLRKWKISLLQRNPAHMTWAIDGKADEQDNSNYENMSTPSYIMCANMVRMQNKFLSYIIAKILEIAIIAVLLLRSNHFVFSPRCARLHIQ
jgi:hypothetical protein